MAKSILTKTISERSGSFTASKSDITDMIRKKAFELYEKRGRKSGHEMADWLEAERLVKQKII